MKLTVRLVENKGTGFCWFEERLENGQWVRITETEAVCEGNSRHALVKVMEARRQNRLAVFQKVWPEETFDL